LDVLHGIAAQGVLIATGCHPRWLTNGGAYVLRHAPARCPLALVNAAVYARPAPGWPPRIAWAVLRLHAILGAIRPISGVRRVERVLGPSRAAIIASTLTPSGGEWLWRRRFR